ncbi:MULTISPECIES: efflux RND transporter periplasmic adaptor subunit [Bacillaceae]|uniref:Efflux RND transporter periplasmic adaptor subunit n=1 Tax=Evansella alkalicola TaxID=745819 RepID=A0ABS6JQR0_9BACI|nr:MULTISPECIES: efflux RND transporter periplasmic adaptor subunit [Bacillaceae]MBU9720893.1 efflux RND transporter periplasmic adaptor subunit [Bacillus alkalicola]
MKINGKKSMLGLVMLLLTVLIIGCNNETDASGEESNANENEDPTFPVEVNEVHTGVLTSELNVSGNIMAAKHMPVIAFMNAEVVAVHVENGDTVEKGDVLIELDATDMELNLAQAQAGLDAAKANLQSAESMRDQGIKQAEMQLNQARDMYDMVKEAREKAESISTNNSQSSADREKGEEGLDFDISAITEEMEALMENLLVSSTAPSEADERQARTAVRQAEMGLEQAKGSDQIKAAEASVRQAEISVEMAKNQQSNAVVTAPMSGQITNFNVVEGELVSPQAPIMQLVQMDEPVVNISVNESLLPNIEVGQEVTVEVPTFNQRYEGVIKHIGIMPGEQSRAYPVEVSISEPEDNLRVGMHAKVMIHTGKSAEEVLVPIRAVLEENGERVVYVTTDGESAERRVISIGNESSEWYAVERGLEEGELIIVNGNHQLFDGALINVRNGDQFNLGE